MDSLLSFPVGLFHPLQHAGLSRRSPSSRQSGSCASARRGLWRYARFGVVDFEGVSEGLRVFRLIVISYRAESMRSE